MDWFEFKVLMSHPLGAVFFLMFFISAMFIFVAYSETLMPLDQYCTYISPGTFTNNQVLTSKDKCIPYYTGQGYTLQNNTLNGKYILIK